MTDKQRIRISKFLSKHLRHDPAGLGLTLEEGGWAPVAVVIDDCRRKGVAIARADLEEIVATSDKKRFAFDEIGERIRANQGHSVDVDLQLQPCVPPAVLFHGIADHFLGAILTEGLHKMKRHHVHLSLDAETATRVGSRHGRAVVLTVDAAAMARDGHPFFMSANGVWLTDRVPPEYLRVPEE